MSGETDRVDGPLTAKQARFVQEFLTDANGKQAAIRAGYSAATAEQQASRMLRNGKVAAAVKAGQQALAQRAEITAEETLRLLAQLGRGDLRKAFSVDGRLLRPHEWPDEIAAFVSSIEVVTRNAGEGEVEHVAKIRSNDKVAALANIARSLGMFKDTLQVNHLGAVFTSPAWVSVQSAILRALAPFPEARAAVVEALAEL